MTVNELRLKLTAGIDRALSYSRWIGSDMVAILRAIKRVALIDDLFVLRILNNMEGTMAETKAGHAAKATTDLKAAIASADASGLHTIIDGVFTALEAKIANPMAKLALEAIHGALDVVLAKLIVGYALLIAVGLLLFGPALASAQQMPRARDYPAATCPATCDCGCNEGGVCTCGNVVARLPRARDYPPEVKVSTSAYHEAEDEEAPPKAKEQAKPKEKHHEPAAEEAPVAEFVPAPAYSYGTAGGDYQRRFFNRQGGRRFFGGGRGGCSGGK